MKEKIKEEPTVIKNIFKGVAISFVFTMVCLVIFATILTNTDVPESTIPTIITIVTIISILIGSSISNFKIRRNGIINGGLVGCIYLIIIYTLSGILTGEFGLNVNSMITIVLAILFGIIGGIIGVNKKIK